MANDNQPFTAVVTGLICLDAIQQSDDSYKLFTGGTCINVLTILKTYGWNVIPIGRIGNDQAGEFVFNDLNFLNIDTRYISRENDIFTPIYIEIISEEGHCFQHKCPNCSQKFADFIPISKDRMYEITNVMPARINVGYIDRVSEASILLAQECKKRGALIYFEPNRPGERALFHQCLELADIVKYSGEKMACERETIAKYSIPIEIVTWGHKGLQFRISNSEQKSDWNRIPAVACSNFVDAAGSGDWLSAHFIHQISEKRVNIENLLQSDTLYPLLQQAQQVASENCRFEGARGSMYKPEDIQKGSGFCPYCEF